MTLRKTLLIVGFLLVLTACSGQTVFARTAPAVGLFFQGQPVMPEVKRLIRNDHQYLNLQFFNNIIGADCIWQADTGLIRLQFGMDTFDLEEGQLTYRLNQIPKQLTAAPFAADGQLWLPLELVAEFGVMVQSEAESSLVLGWADQYLLKVSGTTYEGRPALLLTGTTPLRHTSFTLVEPDRLVINLTGVKAHPALTTASIVHPLIKQVRFSQFDPETLRLVCDLEKLRGYRIITDPANANRIIVVFNCFLQSLNLVETDSGQKIQIKTDYPTTYTVKRFSNPTRAVIDLENATLDAAVTPLTGNGKWFQQVRLSQFNPHTVRVVVDLAGEASLFKVGRSHKDPKLLEVRTLQFLTGIKWIEPTPALGKLVIDATDYLDVKITKLPNPLRLQLDFDFLHFATNLQAPPVGKAATQIKAVRLISPSPTMARIEIELKYFAGFTTEHSADGRRLTLSFPKSPLIDRTMIIDAGHGGEDNGATGFSGTPEKQINLDVTMRLKGLLEAAGAKVLLTRNDDYFIGLYERAHLANRWNGELFVSIHSNAHPNPEIHGFEVYHYQGRERSGRLAQTIAAQMEQIMPIPSLGVKVNDFVVVRETMMPSVLVELGYLSNPEEEKNLNTVAFKDKAALGIFQGIVAYYLEADQSEQTAAYHHGY
ncbi:MAG TPA: N-acetylmuramoyl-L-alanine amidase [Bacillota bacterium]